MELCLYSIADNHAYLRYNRDPVEKMISLLRRYFKPNQAESPSLSLAIQADAPPAATDATDDDAAVAGGSARGAAGGAGGARLTHKHERQFAYVLQSLQLWRAIMNDMFKLWTLAEADLLAGGGDGTGEAATADDAAPRPPYTLEDTGQGFHRVQACPRIQKAMRELLHDQQLRAQQQQQHQHLAAAAGGGGGGGEGGGWVGSSVVHLGDHNVPNSLVFIDKYNQVARILSPIVLCIEKLPTLAKEPNNRAYFEQTFGGVQQLQKEILADFFRGGFDGSGADNFFDAGSCIDGRLTSAWNWCSKLEEKRFFPVFLLAGFSGFDGDDF